ncbi:nucleoside transporter [bacterium]|nr:nucleoside transporter [bacterium]
MERYNLISFAGIFILMGLAWIFSANRKKMNWRLIFWGVGLQMIFAAFIFWLPAGRQFFLGINQGVVKILDSAMAGTEFVFGRLALPPGTENEAGETSLGFFLAFQAFPAIVFFAALMSVLYFLKIMPVIIRGFAYVFTKLMHVSGAESMCAASNIFVGIESTLTVKPFLANMTRSELATVLTAGMATVASNVLALYVFMLQGQFPTIAGHLVSASILSAPAALIMSKIILPESGTPETLGMHVQPAYTRENNLFEAIINGANSAVRLIVGIAALLIAVLGLVALLDLILGGVGSGINRLFSISMDWTLKGLLGYLFYPVTLIIGIPLQDAWEISKIIGERAVVTEVTAYQDLAVLLSRDTLVHARSAFICTYALCGFAHVASLAIFVGGVTALIPERKNDLSVLGPRALLAATLACLMTAAVAGTFYNQGSILLGN